MYKRRAKAGTDKSIVRCEAAIVFASANSGEMQPDHRCPRCNLAFMRVGAIDEAEIAFSCLSAFSVECEAEGSVFNGEEEGTVE